MSKQKKYKGENMVIEYIAELGMNYIKDRICQERDRKIIGERLKLFLEGQTRINELCSLEEEIDFEGLAGYIRSDLMNDVQEYLTGNWRERRKAHTSIINKVVIYSQANTSVSRRRAIEFTETAIEVIRFYLRSKLDEDLKLLAREIEETVDSSIECHSVQQTKELKQFGIKQKEQIVQELKEVIENNNPMSIDKNIQLMQIGNIDQIEMHLQNFFKTMSGVHSLSPHYGFDYNGKIYSKPVTKEALEKYPPKISCTGTIQMNGRYIDRLDFSTFDYANRHQLPIILNVVTAKKYLGDIVDPIQHEAEELVGETFTIQPEPFPPAFPCSISLNDVVMFDYVLLRTEEIWDDGTIIISNHEQVDFSYKIKMLVNPKTKYTTYSICTDAPNNREMLHYLKFLKQASLGAEIKVRVLSVGEELARGKTGNIDYATGFESIDNEIAFVEKVVEIEKYFCDSISIPEEISRDYYHTVSYLANLVRGDESTGGWSKFEVNLALTKELRRRITESDNEKFSLSYVGSISVTLFEKPYELSVVKVFESVIYQDIDKLKRKVEVLDEGDIIKLTFLPGDGENGIWRDKLYTDEGIKIQEQI